jgi:hypothetical protein
VIVIAIVSNTAHDLFPFYLNGDVIKLIGSRSPVVCFAFVPQ